MKYLTMFLLALIIVMAGCATSTPKLGPGDTPPTNHQTCDKDEDCAPQPGCHPINCINSGFADRYESQEACTLMYSCGAAYEKQDCICQDHLCMNKKILVGDPNCVADLPPQP